jgi:hypothetical protein
MLYYSNPASAFGNHLSPQHDKYMASVVYWYTTYWIVLEDTDVA